jgi:methyl-accepting chemotaxis protein
MNWFVNLPIRSKLIAGFAPFALLLCIVIATACVALESIPRCFSAALDLQNLRSKLNRERADLLAMVSTHETGGRDAALQDLKACSLAGDVLLQRVRAARRADKDFQRQIAALSATRDAYIQIRDKQVIPAILDGKTDDAVKLILGSQRDRHLAARAIAEQLGSQVEEDARWTATFSIIIVLSVAAIALVSIIVLIRALNTAIADPIRRISTAAERIAAGDLTVRVSDNHRHDEVGALSETFCRMTGSLCGMAEVARQIASGDLRVKVQPHSEKDILGNAFATMVANLRDLAADISDSVNILGSAANEISVSTAALAENASHTAVAVTETTTTVEEVRQTAEIASQKTKMVSESARKAAQTSEAGKKSTQDATAGMNRIRENMESIAETMVRLSEQSQAVSDIIATVDDLAQQSNLLAVNAAIEATKAGEHGRGFAVVAQEVRTLAEQSREATTQVRAILNDIQKATAAAVMATEQGNKSVEAGARQSAEAGESIQTLANSVAEAAQAAAQIATSSQQQVVGVNQVVTAMENIKHASTRSVAGATQIEAAARNLSELGAKLKGVVQRLNV